jgi:hypothetical protein
MEVSLTRSAVRRRWHPQRSVFLFLPVVAEVAILLPRMGRTAGLGYFCRMGRISTSRFNSFLFRTMTIVTVVGKVSRRPACGRATRRLDSDKFNFPRILSARRRIDDPF